MRIIIKPLGMAAIALVIGGAFATVTFRNTKAIAVGASRDTVNLVSSEKWKFYTEKGALGNLTMIQESLGGVSRTGVKIVTDQPGMQPWNVGVSNPLGRAFKKGEKLQLRFWGRSVSSSRLTIILQRNVPGFPDCFKQDVNLTPEWRPYQYDVTMATMAQWESMVAVHCGHSKGTIELVGTELVPA
jgi:hypothetical protein